MVASRFGARHALPLLERPRTTAARLRAQKVSRREVPLWGGGSLVEETALRMSVPQVVSTSRLKAAHSYPIHALPQYVPQILTSLARQ
jgi:hypothetical protein